VLLYGTASAGGKYYNGTVLMMALGADGVTWTQSVLYSFKGGTTDGKTPMARLTLDDTGKLYGTTYQGGIQGERTAFKLAPTSNSAVWTETLIHSFAGIVMPRCNTAAMSEHLLEISSQVASGAQAVLLLDQAGWHVARDLKIPVNITLMSLPAKFPELNPQENIWQFMGDNWLSSRIFKSYNDILDHCSDAWKKLADQPWRLMSIGLRDWAHAY
jgi:DDE superfamily endonuclease